MLSAIIGGVKAAASAFSSSKFGAAAIKAAPSILGNVASTAFNKRQVDTSYQRTMDDMRKAGINPLLAGKVGPIGSAQAADFGGTLSTARQIGTQETQTSANVNKINQEIENLKSTKTLTEEQTTNLRKTYFEIIARTEKLAAEGSAVTYDNVYKSIIASHQQKYPGTTIAKYYGIDPATITKSILNILKLGK